MSRSRLSQSSKLKNETETARRSTNRTRISLKKQSRSRSGVAAVEFAITFPILLLLIFGSYELCRGNMMMQTTEAAAYEGTRVAIVPGGTAAEAEAAARRVLATAGVRNANVVVTPADLGTETESIAVTITVNFSDNFFLARFFMGNEPFVRTCELNRENL